MPARYGNAPSRTRLVRAKKGIQKKQGNEGKRNEEEGEIEGLNQKKSLQSFVACKIQREAAYCETMESSKG